VYSSSSSFHYRWRMPRGAVSVQIDCAAVALKTTSMMVESVLVAVA
jgi:regulator of sirC expression with transglutaminase-like and TPR domain